ncbi:MAG: hypothetical protein MK202_07115 [Tenacibaculum sp.]|nr:hypothetical protein [Tenacibaculum sp.]
MKNKIITILLLSSILIITSCEAPKTEKNKNIVSPNQDSELALLMREIYDEAMINKKHIQNNEPIEINLDHEKIFSAIATEPEKAASPEFKAFATSYLQSIKNLKFSNTNQTATNYKNMVNNCLTCHQSLCPGPIVRIKKLQ